MASRQMVPYPAPDFQADGLRLKDFAGRWVVLYFYPKDETPGCTTQACSLRDVHDELNKLGAVVIGISPDGSASHVAFKERHQLPFHLISDPEKEVIAAYGAWGPKMFGREGVLRKTFLIDPSGMVRKAYGRATPLGHGANVVAALKELMS